MDIRLVFSRFFYIRAEISEMLKKNLKMLKKKKDFHLSSRSLTEEIRLF